MSQKMNHFIVTSTPISLGSSLSRQFEVPNETEQSSLTEEREERWEGVV
jgi:hypothetical protein